MDGRQLQRYLKELRQATDEIPWPALRSLASAVAEGDCLAVEGLIFLFDGVREDDYDGDSCADLLVPVVFALAGPRLDEAAGQRIGGFLIEALDEAAAYDEDILAETLTTACGCLGPTVLPLVIDAIKSAPDQDGGWFYLWSLTELGAETDDPALRERVERFCVDRLEAVLRRDAKLEDVFEAARTLALLGSSEHLALIERVAAEARRSYVRGDYDEAVRMLREPGFWPPGPAKWHKPVEQWFTPCWQCVNRWLDDDESEPDEEAMDQWIDDLAERFSRSSQAAKLPVGAREHAEFAAHSALDMAWNDCDCRPEELDTWTLRRVLLELFAEKLTAEAAFFECVPEVMILLLEWLESEGILKDSSPLAAKVRQWCFEIVRNGMAQECWGPSKRIAMRAIEDGVDLLAPGALDQYMAMKQLALPAWPQVEMEGAPEPLPFEPPVPIVNIEPKTGRNAPCPCGSGHKYKKCCGAGRNQPK